jgi:muramoyltetrapeptide carboxypeptidase
VELLRGWGLDVVLGNHVLARTRHHAGTDEERAADLEDAWCDPSVRAVLCARGGSGAARLLDRLDWARMRAAGPKVLVGFSDITVLHQAVARHLGLTSLFGPMPAAAVLAGARPDPDTIEHLRLSLFEPEEVQVVTGSETVVPGLASGPTVGGTMALLANAVGTPEAWPAAGSIALLEDVAEPAYRLDSMLTQLLRTGWFDGVRGIALGSWADCGDGAMETVVERLVPLGVPMVTGFTFGHCTPQVTVPWGVLAELDTGPGTLAFREPGLA